MFFQCHCTCAMLILFFVSSAIFFAYVENRATASCPHRGRVVVANRAKRDYGAEDAAYADAENGRPDYRIYDDGETVGGPDHRADDGCPVNSSIYTVWRISGRGRFPTPPPPPHPPVDLFFACSLRVYRSRRIRCIASFGVLRGEL